MLIYTPPIQGDPLNEGRIRATFRHVCGLRHRLCPTFTPPHGGPSLDGGTYNQPAASRVMTSAAGSASIAKSLIELRPDRLTVGVNRRHMVDPSSRIGADVAQ